MLEAAVLTAFISAAIILVVLAVSAGDRREVNHARPSEENWRHW